MSGWGIERIRKSHQRTGFRCGTAALDDFLSRHARQNDAAGIGRTFVAIKPGQSAVCGYYTLAAGGVCFDELPLDQARRLPRYPVPVVVLARLAVDSSAQGQGLGRYLLMDALKRSLSLAEGLGIFAVAVSAKDEAARAFYLRYGFQRLKDDRLHLFLAMTTIRKIFA